MVSSTEPARLRACGAVSTFPERYGADILVPAAEGGWFGIQRKERQDLMGSMWDGRLAEQIAKMRSCKGSLLIVEGDLNWTGDGVLMGSAKYGRPITRDHFDGTMWSLQQQGTWLTYTEGLDETIRVLEHLEKWAAKDKHLGMQTRGRVDAMWGTPTSRDFQVHLLTGVPNVGPELANRMLDHFGGMPWRWRDEVTEEELCKVPGIGKKKAKGILGAIG